MIKSPLVSVIMPTYNAGYFLDTAIKSILGQTLRDFEFIIINDGSTDKTAGILRHYANVDNRVRVFHQENRGIVASLNRGISVAVGKYIARMDSDDVSLPERLFRQVAFMEGHPAVGVCGTAFRCIGDGTGSSWTTTESEQIKCRQLLWPCFGHPTVMMRRELMIEHDLLYRSEFEHVEDYDLWLRFSGLCQFANLPEQLLLYRIHGSQICKSHHDRQNSLVSELHRRAIGYLGITPSNEELALHLSLHLTKFECSHEYVDKVEAWLIKMLISNEENCIYDKAALPLILFERWSAVCNFSSSMLGLSIWKQFRKSRLYSGYHTSCPRRVSFLTCLAGRQVDTCFNTATRFLTRMPFGSWVKRALRYVFYAS